MSTLITGFEPFGDYSSNPTKELARRLAAVSQTAVLPVEFGAGVDRVRALMDEHRPEIVLSLGLNAAIDHIAIERVALNLKDASMSDNAGVQPSDEPVIAGAPDAYLTTLPVKAIVAAITAANILAKPSLSAGTYVCNSVMFGALELASRMPEKVRPWCGFIHVPPASVMGLDAQEEAIKIALATAAAFRLDQEF